MKTVFISYAHEDRDVADSIVQVLEQLGVDYFRDVKDTKWGERITKSVHEALDDSLAVLVILSSSSLSSPWVPYEIGNAVALGKIVLPFVTDPDLKLPLYLQDLTRESSVDGIRKYFRETLARDNPAVQRMIQELLLFREEFHNSETARKLAGSWHATWTRKDRSGPETVFEEDELEVWTTRSRIRILGRDSKPGTPEHLPYYPMEGVVSENNRIALSYWAGGSSSFCGTALLKRRGGGGTTYLGHWRGFESDHYDDDEPVYVEGRVVITREKKAMAEFRKRYWPEVLPLRR